MNFPGAKGDLFEGKGEILKYQEIPFPNTQLVCYICTYLYPDQLFPNQNPQKKGRFVAADDPTSFITNIWVGSLGCKCK